MSQKTAYFDEVAKKLQGRSSGLGSKETPKTCDEAKEEVLD